MYRHDQAGTGYSPLTQINTQERREADPGLDLSPAERRAGGGAGGRGGPGGVNSQATPIVVNGVMYLPAANRVVALEPETGKEIWRYPVTGGAPSRRGVAYWPGEGGNPPRIIFTAGRRLIALNARTGALDAGFGNAGEVDMVVPYNSVPLIYRNVVVVGANTPPGTIGGIGNAARVRCAHRREAVGVQLGAAAGTGRPRHVGGRQLEGPPRRQRLAVLLHAGRARGLLYLPLASPIAGAYGGDRKGANLFGNSVVAVDVQTGTYKWHFQTIHHDLWDADPPAPPGLFDIVRNGRTIPALGADDEVRLPVHPESRDRPADLRRRRAPGCRKSDVPGELAFPHAAVPGEAAAARARRYRAGGSRDRRRHDARTRQGLRGTGRAKRRRLQRRPVHAVAVPRRGRSAGEHAGVPGRARRRQLGRHRVRSQLRVRLRRDPGRRRARLDREGQARARPFPTRRHRRPGRGTFDVRIGDANWPCQKPPWGRLTAVNASTGDIAWQVPLGITEQLPEGKQNTGRPALAGPIVTAGGVLFIASTDDNRFRALDAKTRQGAVGDQARAERQRRPDHVSGQRTASSTWRSSPPTRWRFTRCRERAQASPNHEVTKRARFTKTIRGERNF